MTLRHNYGKYTKSSEARLAAMRDCLLAIERERVPGDVVECGVWRGGNIILARKLAPERLCWLFDTFSGMTEPTALDIKPNGARALDAFRAKTAARPWAAAPLDEVRSYFAETGTLDDDRLRFVVGPVEQTLLDPAHLPERIALLRLDTDWHASTKVELELLYPRARARRLPDRRRLRALAWRSQSGRRLFRSSGACARADRRHGDPYPKTVIRYSGGGLLCSGMTPIAIASATMPSIRP